MGNNSGSLDIFIDMQNKELNNSNLLSSFLYEYLLAIPGNTLNNITVTCERYRREICITGGIGDKFNRGTKRYKFNSELSYEDDNLLISINKNIIFLKCDYNITYVIDEFMSYDTDIDSTARIQSMIVDFITKEIQVNEFLSKYRELKSTKLYQHCKYILIKGLKKKGYMRLEHGNRVLYGYHNNEIAISVPELHGYERYNITTKTCIIDTCGYVLLTESEMEEIRNNKTEDADYESMGPLDIAIDATPNEHDIVEAILDKVMNREYNIPGLLEGVAISHIKRAL